MATPIQTTSVNEKKSNWKYYVLFAVVCLIIIVCLYFIFSPSNKAPITKAAAPTYATPTYATPTPAYVAPAYVASPPAYVQPAAPVPAYVQPPAPVLPPKTYLNDYNYNKCEIDGYDVRSESINGRSVEQIAKLCSETPNCNSFNWDGSTTYLKNVPNGAKCINGNDRNFYSLKSKNIIPSEPKTYINDYNYNKCEIDGYDVRSESINGRSVEQIAKLCSETPNCNSFNWDGSTTYLKNVPDGSRCINGPNRNFYSLKTKNIIPGEPISPPPPKVYLNDYNYNRCEIDGYDVRSESINGRSVEQIAKLCSETPNCNSFNWDGTTTYLKNVPDGSRCINGPTRNFYSLKSKNIIPGEPIGPKVYLNDYNYNRCEIDGYDVRSESINGRSVEQIAKLCSETPNCNSFNWDGTTSYLKNVPNGSRCINGANRNFYSLKTKNIIPS